MQILIRFLRISALFSIFASLAFEAPADCVAADKVARLSSCIDMAKISPRACLEDDRSTEISSSEICDQDHDGLDDHFEDALAKSYAPVFAFNEHLRSEINWPGNIEHFVGNSLLLYAPTGVRGQEPDSWSGHKILRESLSTADLEDIVYEFQDQVLSANNPGKKHGSNFWLCQKKSFDAKKYNGPLGPDEMLTSTSRSALVPGGVGMYAIVHPSSWTPTRDVATAVRMPWPRYVLVAFELFFPYNEHPADQHEGDWEGIGVFVDTEDPSGAVVGAYFQRHNSVEHEQLIMTTPKGSNNMPEIEPQATSAGSEPSSNGGDGLHYWDHLGVRHHVVAYVAAGDHATYHHPGETRLIAVPWPGEPLWLTDLHYGDGFKLLAWRDSYFDGWDETNGMLIRDGVNIVNLGEEYAPRVAWANYRGQWGCQNGILGKLSASWPNPFGNERHCRGWLRHNWGATIPFVPPAMTPDCGGM